MVLTEALAAGTTVVASDIAGYREVVRDGVTGVLVPPGDARALTVALRDLGRRPSRRRGSPTPAPGATPGSVVAFPATPSHTRADRSAA